MRTYIYIYIVVPSSRAVVQPSTNHSGAYYIDHARIIPEELLCALFIYFAQTQPLSRNQSTQSLGSSAQWQALVRLPPLSAPRGRNINKINK